jgi:peptide/nickel transport system substrate-binding protein
VQYYPHDYYKRAARELELAGWRIGPDGIRSKSGRRLSIELVSVTGAKANEAVGVAWQDSWRAIGVEQRSKTSRV